jgi:DegV family protein with EDD domain
MSTKIIIDSTVDLPAELRARTTVVPLVVRFGEEEYQDGVTISYQQFYEKLLVCKDLPSSSQPNPDTFAEVFQSVVDAGDEAVVLTISGRLSGTYQSACIAAEDFKGIYVVDSTVAAVAAGILAQYALKLADEGMDARSIAHKLDEEKGRVRLFAVLDTLEFLKRGGRLSATAAMAGSLLNIKPVITLNDGIIEVAGKARGLRRGNAMMNEQVELSGGVDTDMPMLMGYTGLTDELLRAYLDGNDLWPADVAVSPLGSTIGTHIGPGAYAVAYFCKK